MAERYNQDRGPNWIDLSDTTKAVPRATTDEGATTAEVVHARNYVWNTGTLVWDRATQAGGGGGGVVDTELPAATVMSDADANPTTSRIGANILLWNGATWDRARGTIANGLVVDVSRVQGTVTVGGTVTSNVGTGPWPVTDNGGSLTVDGTVAVSGAVDTELPAAAALADNTANPTVPGVAGFGMLWDGATWDRRPGNSTDGTLVNLGANNDVTVTGSVSVTGSVDTELPTAAALTDNFANPTVPGVGGFNMLWDGATWDRAAGTSVDGALVNLGANNDVTVTGTVTANAGTGPFPVSDNGGSLTVDGAVTVSGTATTTETRPSGATLANVAGTGASVSLIASNANRRAATIFNDSGVVAYVKFGATASSTSFTVKMVDQSYFEVPQPCYTGVIEGLWASGTIRVTEVA